MNMFRAVSCRSHSLGVVLTGYLIVWAFVELFGARNLITQQLAVEIDKRYPTPQDLSSELQDFTLKFPEKEPTIKYVTKTRFLIIEKQIDSYTI